VAVRTTVLCIVSGERLSGSDFVAALRESLRPHEQLEIIVDRRSGEPMGEWERLDERRRRPQVDLALRANGFAFVPAGPSSDRMPTSDRPMGSDRTRGSDRVTDSDRMTDSERTSGSDRMFSSERMPISDRTGSDRMPDSDRMANHDRTSSADRAPSQDRTPGPDRMPSRDRMAGPDRNWTPEDEDRDWSPSSEGRSVGRLSRLLPSAASDRDVDEVDDDDERLEAIRDFKRERSGGLVPWLVVALIAAAVAAFLLSPTGQTVRNSLMSRLLSTAPSSSPSQSASETAAPAPVAEKPSQPATPRDSGAGGAPRESSTSATGSARPTDSAPAVADTPAGGAPPSAPPAGNVPNDGGTAPKAAAAPDAGAAPSTRAPANGPRPRAESAAPPRESADAVPRAGSTPGELPRPSKGAPRETASAIPAPDAVSRTFAPRFAGLPRVELIREGGSSGAYAVKIADPAGKPLSDAEVLLIARMADGTLENVRMGFVPEQGAYRGMLPPVRSTPVDLRIRVITGDKRVEIPVGP
jgi:ribonuclease E